MHSVLLIYTPNFFQYYIHTFSQILILGFTTPTQVASATHWLIEYCSSYWCFPGGSAGKESARNAGDLGSIPAWGKIPWGRERLPTPVFWPGEFHGLQSPWGCKVSNTTERLSLHILHTAKLPLKLTDYKETQLYNCDEQLINYISYLLLVTMNKLNSNKWRQLLKKRGTNVRTFSKLLKKFLVIIFQVCACVFSSVCLFATHDCSPPGSSVHGLFLARILEQVGCHFLLQRIFPTQGAESSLSQALAVEFFTSRPPGKPVSFRQITSNTFQKSEILILFSKRIKSQTILQKNASPQTYIKIT